MFLFLSGVAHISRSLSLCLCFAVHFKSQKSHSLVSSETSDLSQSLIAHFCSRQKHFFQLPIFCNICNSSNLMCLIWKLWAWWQKARTICKISGAIKSVTYGFYNKAETGGASESRHGGCCHWNVGYQKCRVYKMWDCANDPHALITCLIFFSFCLSVLWLHN